MALVVPDPVQDPVDRGVVLVVERDRARLQRLDLLLSQRGYTVVSMTRARLQLSRLARALRPRAILLERSSDGISEVLDALRAEDEPIPVLVFAREAIAVPDTDVLVRANDLDLVEFVDQQA
jgi:CheY-like chemotaxis protein